MILVTGGTGFLGGEIVKRLAAEGRKVRVLVRDPEKCAGLLPDGAEAVEGDLLDVLALEKAMEGVHQVIHSAAVVSFWKKRREEMRRINVEGTANLVNVSVDANVQRFVHVSSIATFGRSREGGMITEKTSWKESSENSYYSITKRKAEIEVYRGIAEGLPAVIANPGVVIGPGNWLRGTPGIFRIVKRGLPVYNPGSNGFVGLDDAAKAIILLLDSDFREGEKFILVSENLTYQLYFSLVAKYIGKHPPTWLVPEKPGKFAGMISEWWSAITGKEPIITTETARTASRSYFYDAAHFCRTFGYVFEPMEQVIEKTAKKFTEEWKSV